VSDKIVEFYEGGKDHAGRTLSKILSWDDELLERKHDYIQWVFPNRRPSPYNEHAPLVTDETVMAFRQSSALRSRLAESTDRMEAFYAETTGFKPSWVSDANHNYLRITRILLCLVDLGLPDRAQLFFEARNGSRQRWARDPDQGPTYFWLGALKGK
jgi:hypothetical protein